MIIYENNTTISGVKLFPLVFFFQFVLIMCYQYLDLPIMGKKLAISIVALNLMSITTCDSKAIWGQFLSVLLGCAISLIGTLFPIPIIASVEVRERVNYGSHCLSTLLEDSINFWLLLPSSSEQSDQIGTFSNEFIILHNDTQWIDEKNNDSKCQFSIPRKNSNSHNWRKALLIIRTLYVWKRTKNSGLGFFQRPNSRVNHFLRLEVVIFLENSLRVILARQVEARFGPNREQVVFQYGKYVKLMQDLLLIVSAMESSIEKMHSCSTEVAATYKAFFGRPEFRSNLFFLLKDVTACLESISSSLLNMHQRNSVPAVHAATILKRLAAMLRARDGFDEEYLRCRKVLYYGECEIENFVQRPLRRNSIHALPLYSDVVMQMNSFLFLVDTICELLVSFISFDDMIFLAETGRLQTTGVKRMEFSRAASSLLTDLFPPQRHLFQWIRGGRIPPNIILKLRASISLALAMTIAGVFGVYCNRPQPALAAFTIAYLAGGSATGASILTSFNRSFGTVIASVYCILVAYIMIDWESKFARNIFILFAVTLFQLPAAYVRTFPMSGYCGTVAGFTVPILLLAPNNGIQGAVDRIIDTYVGVAIYLFVELSCNARYTEVILLDNIGVVFDGFTEMFREFFNNLESFNPRTSEFGEEIGIERTSFISSAPSSIGSLRGMIEQQRTLILFSAAEPAIIKPPPFPRQFYEQIVSKQEVALRNLQIMLWAVQPPNAWFRLKNMETGIRLLDEFLQFDNYEGKEEFKQQDSLAELLKQLRGLQKASAATSAETARTVQGSSFNAILEAIRPHYKDVYNSLSATMMSLSTELDAIKHYDTSSVKESSVPRRSSAQSNKLSAYYGLPTSRSSVEAQEELEFLVSSSKSKAIVENYHGLIVKIRNTVIRQRKESSGDLSESHLDLQLSEVMSNRELKVITAVVVGTRELLAALEELLAVVHRMQAQRVIHFRHDGRTL